MNKKITYMLSMLLASALFTSCRSFFYTGKSVIGVFERSGKPEERSGEAAERFVESLFGCYVFAVLRPSLTMD